MLVKGPIPEGTFGGMVFGTVFGKVHAHIEFLHRGADGVPLAQAFTFITMDTVSSQRFKKALAEMNTSEFSHDARERSHFDVAFEILSQSLRQLSEMLNSVRRAKSKV